MTTFVIPYRVGGKTRLGDPELAAAMLADVRAVREAQSPARSLIYAAP
jgi:hypothetical protein